MAPASILMYPLPNHPGVQRLASSPPPPIPNQEPRLLERGEGGEEGRREQGESRERGRASAGFKDRKTEGKEAPGQDFVTLDYRLRYYPSITYAVIGSAVIFVLVVALLALVLHHQRKRSVLLPRGVRGGSLHHHHHQPLLLSRLVILDRGHVHPAGPGSSPGSPGSTAQYSAAAPGLQLLSGTLYPNGVPMDSPPSYSQAVLDVSRPPWFDLPPPPYLQDGELPSEGELPQYEEPTHPSSHPSTGTSEPPAARTVAPGLPRPSLNTREESDQL
ncbi:low-density lipoprotein receptor class A domain-containing protein 3 [Osmerus mordax]|uniref:low-density lipoprotein receptor class A domain-containing protein 3 n=1 Tax=Osmerus mordax TaxID=8014 RepID=UPI00350F96FC